MINKGSTEWQPLKDWLLEQIEKRRLLLEKSGRTHDETNEDRGFIAAYRHLISTVEPKETRGGTGTNYHKR